MVEVSGIRKIGFITTARSDYNTMYPIIRAAQIDSGIEAITFCAGMHLSERFGATWKQLERDGIQINEKIVFELQDDRPKTLAKSLGKAGIEFANALSVHEPDLLCVSGDRIENLPLLTAATAMGIPIAHLSGGDLTEGAFDDQIRHSITKLSHLHFVCMDEHAGRVIQMGEEPWRVTVTGDAALDFIVNFEPMTRPQLMNDIGIPEQGDLVLVIFHPQTLSSGNATKRYRNILQSISNVDAIPILIYPNIDPGFELIIDLLEDFSKLRPDAIIRSSFDREHFYSLMHHALFMIGNSSSGIWEAPSFKLPAINIGERQNGRKRSKNIVDLSGEDLNEIKAAIDHVTSTGFLTSLAEVKNPFGNGTATQKTLSILKGVELGDRLMNKKFYKYGPGFEVTTIRESD